MKKNILFLFLFVCCVKQKAPSLVPQEPIWFYVGHQEWTSIYLDVLKYSKKEIRKIVGNIPYESMLSFVNYIPLELYLIDNSQRKYSDIFYYLYFAADSIYGIYIDVLTGETVKILLKPDEYYYSISSYYLKNIDESEVPEQVLNTVK